MNIIMITMMVLMIRVVLCFMDNSLIPSYWVGEVHKNPVQDDHDDVDGQDGVDDHFNFQGGHREQFW